MIERALLIKIARVFSTAFNQRPVRTTVDSFGTMSHVVSTTRRAKYDFKFTGVYSKKITNAFHAEFPAFQVLVHEARVPLILIDTVISVPYITGSLRGPAPGNPGESVVVFFSLDPVGTLTVRQLQKNVLERQEQTSPGNLK